MSAIVDVGDRTGGRFGCTQCDYRTSTKQILGRHIAAVHLQLKEFQCTNCQKAFGFYSTLKIHQKQCNYVNHLRTTETDEEHLCKCDQCGVPFLRRHDIPRHYLDHHVKQEQLQCDYCGKCFQLWRSLENHVLFSHLTTIHVCTLCNLKFETKSRLIAHKIAVHSPPRRSTLSRIDVQNGCTKMVCDKCDDTCLISEKYQRKDHSVCSFSLHIMKCQLGVTKSCQINLMHRVGPTMFCDDCNLSFRSLGTYRCHMTTKHYAVKQNGGINDQCPC